MKDGPDSAPSDSNPGSATFAHFRAKCCQHGFDRLPPNIRANRILENRFERLAVFARHGLYSIIA
jgi:hypothetical protein